LNTITEIKFTGQKNMSPQLLGKIIGGSFAEGLFCRLESDVAVPKIGSYCSVVVSQGRIFTLVTDVVIESKHPEVNIPLLGNKLFWDTFQRHNGIKTARLLPLLLIDEQGQVKNFSQMTPPLSFVYASTEDDFTKVFGKEELDNTDPKLCLGSPSGMQADVCIDLKKFVERSNGIFGKTGTGKTFVTRMILASLVRTGVCVNLIFDMHGEYGLSARSESGSLFVLGLKSLFPQKIALFSLDPEATRQRGCSPDIEVAFDLSEITVDDVIALQTELNLHTTAVEAANLLYVAFGKNWLYRLLANDVVPKDLAAQIGAHAESLSALYRKVKRIESLPFIRKTNDNATAFSSNKNSVANVLLEYLDKGISVILEFGRQTSSLTYLLVSGILTRQIHKAYIKKTENFLATQQRASIPKPLVITIEEAHKFLNPTLAKQTIFGMIAREMRKYFVTLLVVDQRPSGICSEVISQLGTKISGKLEDERDLATLFQGSGNYNLLKNLISNLESKGQVFLSGHAVPIPIALRMRKYDELFYAKIQAESKAIKPLAQSIDEVFFK
jgi:DNA helicase HerA-like ATPase